MKNLELRLQFLFNEEGTTIAPALSLKICFPDAISLAFLVASEKNNL